MSAKTRLILCLYLLGGNIANGQIPVEVFVGQKRSTVDIMFFKYFRNRKGEQTNWLFFNRNRAGVDHRMTETNYLPQFGFTEAISYNHKKLKGIAPVAVGQIMNAGTMTKAGVQYAHLGSVFTAFTWLVTETNKNPDIDHFVLVRYTPKLSKKLQLFTQLELLTVLPTDDKAARSYTQRARAGIKVQHLQSGIGIDLNQTGNTTINKTANAGIFIRYEF